MKKGPLIVFILLFVWLGCDDDGSPSGCKDVKTKTFTPDLFQTVTFQKKDEATFSCFPFTCFHTHGTMCNITVNTPQEVQVGFDYHYENGTPPCNCWWYVDCVFRGGVSFDLNSLQGKNVVGAILKWADRGKCVEKLYVPENTWATFSLSPSSKISNPWQQGSSGAGELQVGLTVRDWVEGNKPNRGWLFVGPDESFANHQWEHGDAEIGSGLEGISKCTSALKGLELKVEYTD